MGVAYGETASVADLSKIDWVEYCANASAFLQKAQRADQDRRQQERQDRRQQERLVRERHRRAWRKAIAATRERHVDTGESFCFATADELDDEVIDIRPIVEVMLERRLQ
jgi:hypothetical protein